MSQELVSSKGEVLEAFSEIQESTELVNNLVLKMNCKLKEIDSTYKNGISLLNVKNILLLQYLINLAYLIILKTIGKSIKDESTVDRLIELRVILERIRPIEQKLKYQIDKVVKISITRAKDENDPSQFKANPDNLMLKSDEESTSEDEDGKKDSKSKKSDVYVPPKMAAVYYDGDETNAEKERKKIERTRKYLMNSSIMQELKEEYLDSPTEVSLTNVAKQKLDKAEFYKQQFEETYFTRLPTTKEDRKRAKQLSTISSIGNEVTKFESLAALDGDYSDCAINKKRKQKKSSHKKGKKRKAK